MGHRREGRVTTAWPGRLWRSLLLPLALIFVWQTWGGMTGNPRTPMPTRGVIAALQLIESGELPLAVLHSLGRVFAGCSIAARLAIAPRLPLPSFRGGGRSDAPV